MSEGKMKREISRQKGASVTIVSAAPDCHGKGEAKPEG